MVCVVLPDDAGVGAAYPALLPVCAPCKRDEHIGVYGGSREAKAAPRAPPPLSYRLKKLPPYCVARRGPPPRSPPSAPAPASPPGTPDPSTTGWDTDTRRGRTAF